MSFELRVRLRKIGEKASEGVILLDMSSTPTRELFDLVHLEGYTENYVSLPKSKVDEIIAAYEDERNRYKMLIVKEKKNQEVLEKAMYETPSPDVYEKIRQDLFDSDVYLGDLKEMRDEAIYWKYRWEFILNVLENQYDYGSNSNDYELVYIAG